MASKATLPTEVEIAALMLRISADIYRLDKLSSAGGVAYPLGGGVSRSLTDGAEMLRARVEQAADFRQSPELASMIEEHLKGT